jgi:hypothetical protein
MKSRLGAGLVLLLLIVVGLLTTGLVHKMGNTDVSRQPIKPPPAIASTAVDADSTAPVAVFIGDFVQGSDEGGEGDTNWTSILTADIKKSMPLRTVVDDGGGGSGYVVRGPSPTFPEQVRRIVNQDARVVTISGSRNDVVADPSQITAAAEDTYRLVQQLAPEARLIVIGPTWGDQDPSDEILQTRDAVRTAAASANAEFIDPIADKWFSNGEAGLVGSDGVSPTDLANLRMAENLYPVFAQNLSGGSG